MKIAGLDIGTTGCKITVFDREGNFLDKAYRTYPVKRGASGHEVDASALLDSVFAVMKEIAVRHPDIAGLGVTSFGEAFVLTDEKGTPLHHAMLLTDVRGSEECRELTDKIGGRRIASITGARPHVMYSLSKIMWMKRNRPEIYAQAKHLFLMEDLVVFALTGKAQIDYSLACRTMGFDIHSLCWSREMFEAAGIDMALMSKPVPTGTSAGTITKEAAERTGLSRKMQVISVSHDQVAAAVGAGIFGPDKAVDGAGTSECITILYKGLPDADIMYEGYYSVVPYVVPDTYVCYAFLYMGGALIQWCVDTLAKKEKKEAEKKGISVNELLEQECLGTDGEVNAPTGLLVLPHFAGAATPYMDTGARGAVLGLTAGTTLSDIYLACMEGVGYEMMLNMEFLSGSGLQVEMLHATGGGARSEVWMQMKADMLNIPITALKTVDAGTAGSAMLTGIAIGCYKNLEEAAACMVEKTRVYYPRAEMHEKYLEVYKRYREVYKAVRPLV